MRSRETVSDLATALARQGLVVFVGDLRLACDGQSPLCGYHYPAPQADVHSLIRFATSHGAEYGARAGPIGVFGLSSGAELALMAAFTETGASRPGAVVAWSAPTSFAKLASNPDAASSAGTSAAGTPTALAGGVTRRQSRTPRAPRRRRSSSRRPTIRRCRRRSHGRSIERCTRPERSRNSTSSQARTTPSSATAPSAVPPTSCSSTSPDVSIGPESPKVLDEIADRRSRATTCGRGDDAEEDLLHGDLLVSLR